MTSKSNNKKTGARHDGGGAQNNVPYQILADSLRMVTAGMSAKELPALLGIMRELSAPIGQRVIDHYLRELEK